MSCMPSPTRGEGATMGAYTCALRLSPARRRWPCRTRWCWPCRRGRAVRSRWLRQHGLDRRDDRGAPPRSRRDARASCAADQIWPIGLAMPCPAMSGAEPCTGSNSDGNCRSGLMLPDGAMPMVPVQAGPRSDRMSPNRLEATTTSNQSGLQHEMRGQDVDVVLVPRHVGIVLRHLLDPLVPVRHGDRDAVRLGGRGQVLLRTASARARRRISGCGRRRCGVITVSCMTISRSVPGNIAAADRRILALGVLAHDVEVDVAGLAAGERRRHARHQPHRAQVDVLVELAAELEQRAPQRDVVGHRRRASRRRRRRSRHARRSAPSSRPASSCRAWRNSRRRRSRTGRSRTSRPNFGGAASSTRRPSGTTSLPMPSPGMTAMRNFRSFLRVATFHSLTIDRDAKLDSAAATMFA